MSRTGPVNFEIPETEGGRKSIIHVDKLYQYVPEDGEVLHSWLPKLLTVADAGCQIEISAKDTISKASQVDLSALISQSKNKIDATASDDSDEAERYRSAIV